MFFCVLPVIYIFNCWFNAYINTLTHLSLCHVLFHLTVFLSVLHHGCCVFRKGLSDAEFTFTCYFNTLLQYIYIFLWIWLSKKANTHCNKTSYRLNISMTTHFYCRGQRGDIVVRDSYNVYISFQPDTEQKRLEVVEFDTSPFWLHTALTEYFI